jgi:hypothetical protein
MNMLMLASLADLSLRFLTEQEIAAFTVQTKISIN